MSGTWKIAVFFRLSMYHANAHGSIRFVYRGTGDCQGIDSTLCVECYYMYDIPQEHYGKVKKER